MKIFSQISSYLPEFLNPEASYTLTISKINIIMFWEMLGSLQEDFGHENMRIYTVKLYQITDCIELYQAI